VRGNPAITLPEDQEVKIEENGGKALALWLEETEKNHPALVAARSQLEAAQKRVEATRSAGLPYLGLSANYYQNTRPGEAVTASNFTETTVGLMVTVPIFDGFSSTYKLQGAQAQVEQKEAVLADTERQIAMEVIKAHADATSALQNLEASAALLAAAHNALAVSQRKYAKGAADINELLNTQAALADARQERIRCLAEWRSARLRLLANAGQIGRAAVGE
jgi:outer membrane protein